MIHRECREMPVSSWTDDEKKVVAHACYDKWGSKYGDRCAKEDIDTCGGDCCISGECKLAYGFPESNLSEFRGWCKNLGGMIKDCNHEQTHFVDPLNLDGSCEKCMQGKIMRDLSSVANSCC